MMEIKSDGAQSYTIPLDSVDLMYLSKYVRTPNSEKMPLWRRKCLDWESEYCHVQIDDNEDCYSEETFDTYSCHICYVEVPIMYFKKHNESEKHVTLKTIFQKVLERVSKQINISVSVMNNDKDIDKDVYYCAPCSKIIKTENKHKHESSQYHVNSQRDIHVVYEFNKIFEENKVNEEILDEKRFGTEIIQNDTKNNDVKNVTNEDKCNNAETKTDSSTNDLTMKPTCTVERLVPNDKHNEELNSEEKYFKDMVKKHNLKVNLPIVDGEFINVASPSGVKVKISRDHFHSYLSVDEGIRIYCQMCHISLELLEESKHKVTEEHARNLFLPVNEQFGRSRNVYSSHCLICNTLVMTSSLPKHHLCNDKHVKLLKSAKLADTCQNNEELANRINTENNVERTHTETHKIENHANKSKENKIIEYINNKEYICKLNLSENDLGDHKNESGHIAKQCNISVPQDQMKKHNAGTLHWSNALKTNGTGVADGLQAYFPKDNLNTDSELSEIQNDTPRNDKVAKHNNTPKNDNLKKQNGTLKNDNVVKQNHVSENDNVTNQNDVSEYDNVTNQNDTLKHDNIANQNDTSKNDNVTNQNDTSKNDNVTNQNDTLKNDNVVKQNHVSENIVGNGFAQMCMDTLGDDKWYFFYNN